MKIKKGRLRQIVKEELDKFVAKVNTRTLNESKSTPDKIIALLEELEKDGNKNKLTDEHIDTKSISDKIRTTLLKSGEVQFSAGEIRREIIEELEFQRGSGYVDPTTQKRMGKQVGADFLLTGEISSIKKQRSGTKDVYFKITLNLVDLETALISWADEKEIRKRED